jgi:hypothetical protein
MRRLYRKWAQNGDIAPEDIPSSSGWDHAAGAERNRPASMNSLLVPAICALVIIAFFVLVAVLMSRC